MHFIRRCFRHPIFLDKRFILFIWILLAVIGGLKGSRIHNNYMIFQGVFYHTLEQVNIYLQYPEYHDVNHYGPFFSIIIAPFALLPDRLGVVLWDICMGVCLYYAINCLPVSWKERSLIQYIALTQAYTCIMNSQTNGLIAALIIASLLAIRKEKDIWAACFIMIGTFIKLYGIVGLSFFFFSKHKIKFIMYLLLWSAVFFILPMLISSPAFVIQSYLDWFNCLAEKNIENITNLSQDISVIGMVRRIFDVPNLSTLYIIIPGLMLFAFQYIKPERYRQLSYQLGILASTLMFIVLFSTGSESETYIIALTSIGIWFACLQEYPYAKWKIYIVLFAIIWTWGTSSHLFPNSIRVDIFKKYSLKALPSLIIWLILVYQLITSKIKSQNEEEIIKE